MALQKSTEHFDFKACIDGVLDNLEEHPGMIKDFV